MAKGQDDVILGRIIYRSTSGVQMALDLLLILATLMSILGVAAFGLWLHFADQSKINTFCITMDGNQILPRGSGNPPAITGDVDGRAVGWVQFNEKNHMMTIHLTFSSLDTISGFKVYGPLTQTAPINAPVILPPDGTSYISSSDALTGSGVIHKEYKIDKSTMNAILEDPNLFYLRIDTNVYSAGAIRQSLGQQCKIQ